MVRQLDALRLPSLSPGPVIFMQVWFVGVTSREKMGFLFSCLVMGKILSHFVQFEFPMLVQFMTAVRQSSPIGAGTTLSIGLGPRQTMQSSLAS